MHAGGGRPEDSAVTLPRARAKGVAEGTAGRMGRHRAEVPPGATLTAAPRPSRPAIDRGTR